MIHNTVEYIMNDIRAITENVIIKYSNEADLYESVNSQREADKYIAAKMGRDIFSSYYMYDREVIAKAGITNLNDIEAYHYDRWKIPHKKRDLVLKYQREATINDFVEQNDYYRTLIGLPPKDTPEEEFIYLTEAQMLYYDIDEVRPIHEYPKEIQIKLERVVIPELIKLYPEREYLKHIGSKAVDLVRAREAKNFEIIFTDIILDNVFLRSFFETYDFCREYFMAVIYNKSLASRYELYDNFIAMNIMIMTIQRMVVDTIKTAIDRDFYDLPNLKKFFDCYGVPFFEDLPLDYQRSIVKNMNLLIRKKSTDECLYDVTRVLMLDRVSIYKYYLVRERLMDKNNEPVTKYKTEYDEFGNEIQVLDYEAMYDFYFQSTDIYEPNVILAIENKANRYHYNEVTDPDVHWWEDDDLLKEKYERTYNYIETKYIGINLMQRLSDLLYETCYFINMLVDNKDTTTPLETRILMTDAMKTGTDYLYINLDRITTIPVSIFDSIVIMTALVCKKNSLKGTIITQHAGKILSILGFNFEANFKLIRESIEKYKNIFKDKSILKYLDLLDIKHVDDIEVLYNNFLNFAEFCKERVINTTDIEEYRAYKKLYKVFTVREEVGNAFMLSNGKPATTYMEYLHDKLPDVAKFIDGLHKDKLGVYIDHIIGRLNELVPDIEYLSSINGTNNNIMNALVALINFFKSYTVDLRNLNVIYYLDDKFFNKIRMVDDLDISVNLFSELKSLKYVDSLNLIVGFDKKDRIVIFSQEKLDNVFLFDNKEENFIHADNKINEMSKIMETYEDLNIDYADVIGLLSKLIQIKDKTYKERHKLLTTIYNNDDFEGINKITSVDTNLEEESVLEIQYSDIPIENISIDNIEEFNFSNDDFRINNNINSNNVINSSDNFKFANENLDFNEHLFTNYSDDMGFETHTTKNDKIQIKEVITIIREE